MIMMMRSSSFCNKFYPCDPIECLAIFSFESFWAISHPPLSFSIRSK